MQCFPPLQAIYTSSTVTIHSSRTAKIIRWSQLTYLLHIDFIDDKEILEILFEWPTEKYFSV